MLVLMLMLTRCPCVGLDACRDCCWCHLRWELCLCSNAPKRPRLLKRKERLASIVPSACRQTRATAPSALCVCDPLATNIQHLLSTSIAAMTITPPRPARNSRITRLSSSANESTPRIDVETRDAVPTLVPPSTPASALRRRAFP